MAKWLKKIKKTINFSQFFHIKRLTIYKNCAILNLFNRKKKTSEFNFAYTTHIFSHFLKDRRS